MSENGKKEMNDSFTPPPPLSIKLMAALGALSAVSLWTTFQAVSKGNYHLVLGLYLTMVFAFYFISVFKSIVDIRKDLDKLMSTNGGVISKEKRSELRT